MANQARLAERLIGLFAYFVENGTSTSEEPPAAINEGAYPDADPPDNWLSLGTILPGAQFETEEQDDDYLAPSSAGGFRQVQSRFVMSDTLRFQSREMNELVDRLQFGLSAKISEGTAVAPHVASDRKIRGWLLIQGRQVGGNGSGTDDFRLIWWCDLRLAEQPKYENRALSPALTARMLPNALNSVVFPAAA